MTRTDSAKKVAKNALLYLGLTAAVVVAIPLLAGLAYGVRLLIPLLILATVVALVASPAFRRWFMGEADNSSHYHGVAFPTASLWLHPAHGWANLDRGTSANIGIDAFALTALGPLTAVRPPESGTLVKQGQTLFTLAHGERSLEVKSPLSGKVAAINRTVVEQPELISKSPYGAGWLVSLEAVELEKEKATLRHGSTMRHWWRQEIDRFVQRLQAGGPVVTMADGGELSGDIGRCIDDGKWPEIVREFFGK